ncbi:MAG TPA: aminotransferase class V-fold PLP-dependent enzyme, partial [Bacillota bacterium]|nr:aminotransferase class V-fold PLP-dependent enzyme [Bacillota bacterium]
MKGPQPLIFELSSPGRTAVSLPAPEVPTPDLGSLLPAQALRHDPPGLPEVSEVDVVRHFVNLSQLNHAVDTGFYPLGSCTMKYNPKVNEDAARMPGFARIHPDQDEATVQGAMGLLYSMDKYLSELCGMSRFTFQPVAGAHGEITGLFVIRAYHESRGEHRTKVLVPDSAHGTNPASAAGAGMEIVVVKSDERGNVDVDDLRSKVGPDTAALMLTNPNTLGLFEENVREIAALVHGCGALLYYDGANANAIMGKSRPG